MTRYRLILAVIALAVVCLVQTAEGQRVRRLWNACARRCIRDCRIRPSLHGGLHRVKVCENHCFEYAKSCSVCSSAKTGCTKCARGYTLIFGNQCSRETTAQWVSSVDSFSSEFTSAGLGSAKSIIGKPDLYPNYGDNLPGAWAPLNADSEDYIVVNFDSPVYASAVDVYETLNAGGVVKVSLFNFQDNAWVTVWQTDAPDFIAHSRIFSVRMKPQQFLTKQVRLDVDSRTTGSWVAIDAVRLKGYISH